MKFLLVNGPPRSGKDTMGGVLERLALQQTPNVLSTKLAKALKEMAHDALCPVKGLDHWVFEAEKDKPRPDLYGRTWREVYIAFSEKFAKPLFGEGYWARVLLDEVDEADQDHPLDYVIVTDCGFQTEVGVIREWAEERGHEVVLLKMHRAGCDFSKDSREYVTLNGKGREMDVYNDSTIEWLEGPAKAALGDR